MKQLQQRVKQYSENICLYEQSNNLSLKTQSKSTNKENIKLQLQQCLKVQYEEINAKNIKKSYNSLKNLSKQFLQQYLFMNQKFKQSNTQALVIFEEYKKQNECKIIQIQLLNDELLMLKASLSQQKEQHKAYIENSQKQLTQWKKLSTLHSQKLNFLEYENKELYERLQQCQQEIDQLKSAEYKHMLNSIKEQEALTQEVEYLRSVVKQVKTKLHEEINLKNQYIKRFKYQVAINRQSIKQKEYQNEEENSNSKGQLSRVSGVTTPVHNNSNQKDVIKISRQSKSQQNTIKLVQYQQQFSFQQDSQQQNNITKPIMIQNVDNIQNSIFLDNQEQQIEVGLLGGTPNQAEDLDLDLDLYQNQMSQDASDSHFEQITIKNSAMLLQSPSEENTNKLERDILNLSDNSKFADLNLTKHLLRSKQRYLKDKQNDSSINNNTQEKHNYTISDLNNSKSIKKGNENSHISQSKHVRMNSFRLNGNQISQQKQIKSISRRGLKDVSNFDSFRQRKDDGNQDNSIVEEGYFNASSAEKNTANIKIDDRLQKVRNQLLKQRYQRRILKNIKHLNYQNSEISLLNQRNQVFRPQISTTTARPVKHIQNISQRVSQNYNESTISAQNILANESSIMIDCYYNTNNNTSLEDGDLVLFEEDNTAENLTNQQKSFISYKKEQEFSHSFNNNCNVNKRKHKNKGHKANSQLLSYEQNDQEQLYKALPKLRPSPAIDVYRSFFILTAQCVKLNAKDFNKAISVYLNLDQQYNKVIDNKVPINKWSQYLKMNLEQMLGEKI